MKKITCLLVFVSLALTGFSQYSHRGIYYIGWQVSNNHVSNAYSTHDASNNFTFYNDGFSYHYIDWRIGIYGEKAIGELDLSGFAVALAAITNFLLKDEDMDEYRDHVGKLRQLDKNFPGSTGNGVDWIGAFLKEIGLLEVKKYL